VNTPRAFAAVACLLAACASDPTVADDFHTSGSREADQRAEQRISKTQQMRGETDSDRDEPGVKKSLWERLGGEEGVRPLVDDFVDRVLADPRANWERRGVSHGGVLGVGSKSSEWRATAATLTQLKQHMVQFIAVAAGGPATYTGRDIKAVHQGMKVTNAEFDASIGALKASLDACQVPIAEQKELLAIFESTRTQVAEKR
jgi:hemoglobin